MEKTTAKETIEKTFKAKFDKSEYRNFIINLLDGINKDKAFTCGNAYVQEHYRDYVNSYARVGQYTDPTGKIIDILWVNLKNKTTLERARTTQRNFIADYMKQRQKENILVAFYNEEISDWRFSFVKLETDLAENDKGQLKIVNNFTSAKRYSFLVGEQEPNHTAQSRLAEILTKENPLLSDIEEAFNIEKVSKEFFAIYKELFLQLVDNLKEIRKNEPNQRINHEFTLKQLSEATFCKKLMGQLVFLYFIQKKDWLGVKRDEKWGNGDKKFLRNTFEKAVAEGKNFFNDYVEPLFYEALATGIVIDKNLLDLECKFPFLNGGLFEAINEYDWVNTDIIFDNSIFSNDVITKEGDKGTGILDVFDRYNFTVKEDEPLEKEVAVDPEMLGKVFEEHLEVEDRKSKGAFYTPREIVHYMCQESLINYLSTELNAIDEENVNEKIEESFLTKKAIADFVHHADKIVQNEALAKAKEKSGDLGKTYDYQLAPSIRTNAKEIDKALENIKICDPAIGSGAFPVGMMNEIVRVRMALVESGYLNQTKNRTPYDYKRQAIQNSIYGVDIDCGAIEIAKLRLWLSLVVDEEDIDNINPLPNLDYKIVCGNSLLGIEKNLFNQLLLEKLELLKPLYFNSIQKSEKRRLKKEIDEIITELTKDGSFGFEIYFSEVFHQKNGFDVVIANPPYIFARNSENKGLKESDKRQYYLRYKLAKYQINLYHLFIEEGDNLLKENGVFCYITPNNWLTINNNKHLRELILSKSDIVIVNFYSKVFENANVDSSIIIFKKSNRNNKIKLYEYENNFKLIKESNSNNFINTKDSIINIELYKQDNFIELLNKIEAKTIKLEDIAEIKAGLKAYEVGKGNPKQTKEMKDVRIYHSNNKETSFHYRYLKGSDVCRYRLNWSGEYLKYGDNLAAPRGNFRLFSSERILVRQIPSKPPLCINACLTNETYLNDLNSMNIINIKCNSSYLLGILNSKLISFWFIHNFGKMQRGIFPQFKINELKIFPIMNSNENNISDIVDKILKLTNQEDCLIHEEIKTQIKKYENQIDLMVYKLYELDYSEVFIVDPEFKMSKQEYNNYLLNTMEIEKI